MASARSSNFQAFNETVDEIVQDLVCQLCQGFPKTCEPRWYKCSNLHYICQVCVESKERDKCSSSCKKRISKNADKMAETILKMKTLKFKCQYCKESFASQAITVHESNCTHRLVPCPHITSTHCSRMVKFQEVLAHCELSHDNPIYVMNGSTVYVEFDTTRKLLPKDIYRWVTKIEAFGKVFLTFAMTKNGTMYEWAKLLGPPSESKDYIFNVEYEGPKCTQAFFGEVASIDETFNSIISSGKCSAINSEVFKTQFMENDIDSNSCTYFFTITIKKLDEETSQ